MRVFVAGHKGMVGSAIDRLLRARGVETVTRDRQQLDLLDQTAVHAFLATTRVDAVVLAAAKVGGIHANNSLPASFIHENLTIQANVIDAAFSAGVGKLLFLGSSCIYPRLAPQPMPEEALLTGPLEPTNEPYALAKIAGIKMCESYNRQYGTDYRSVMPTNLYGPGDNFHPEHSHVLPALLRRFHEARLAGQDEVVIWGSGTPKREFLHVDDMASACLHVMDLPHAKHADICPPMMSHINIGSGDEVTIADLAGQIARVTGFAGNIRFDTAMPDGAPRKLLDSSRLKALGWQRQVGLAEGLKQTYQWYLAHATDARGMTQPT